MKPPFLNKQTKTTKSRRVAKVTKPKRRVRADTSSPPPSSFSSTLLKFTSIALILILATGTLLYIKRDQWGISPFLKAHLNQEDPEVKPKPDPEKYAALTAQLQTERSKLRSRYLQARTNIERKEIINEASALLEDRLPSLMRCWLGHPWDFYGTATVPGEGKIACGYFVSTIMRDAGFKINRIRVAQQPSQNIIRTFVNHKEFYEIKTQTPYLKYVDDIKSKYEGIHIVGLDTHVGFIVIKDNEMRFIHSRGHAYVVDEGEKDASSLERSNYRVISNISRNQNVIKKWILGEAFTTVGDS